MMPGPQEGGRWDAGMIADYAVVGAGSAGCVIAARLAEAGSSVILIETPGCPTASPSSARSPGTA